MYADEVSARTPWEAVGLLNGDVAFIEAELAKALLVADLLGKYAA